MHGNREIRNTSRRNYQNRNRRSKRRRERQLIRGFMIASIVAIMALTIFLLGNLFALISKSPMPDSEKKNVTGIESQREMPGADADSNNKDNAGKFNDTEDQDAFAGGETSIISKLENFAAKNNFSVNEYPEELIELLQRNAETEEFVLNYPLKKGSFSKEALTESLVNGKVPLLMQWDDRWGYYEYGNNVMGLTGCGPTCLSMVAIYLLQDESMTPLYMSDYAVNNGYCVPGSGTSWGMMSDGAKGLGLRVNEVSLDEEQIRKNLEAGRPIIAIMGPGDFTDKGHFLVFTGWEDGKIVINDPNSKINSQKLWEYEDIKGQIRGMWAYRK